MGRPKTKNRYKGCRWIKDREGNPRYCYVTPIDGGKEIRLEAERDTPEWEREYLKARGGTAPVRTLAPRRVGSAAKLDMREAVERYTLSPLYEHLSPDTKRNRRSYLRRLVAQRPDALIGDLTKEAMFNLIGHLPRPTQAGFIDAMRPIYAYFGMENPLKGYTLPKKTSKGFRTWKANHVDQYRAYWALGTLQRTMFELAYHTTQRKSDIVDVIGDDGTSYRAMHVLSQHKTKATVLIPIDPELDEALATYEQAHVAEMERRAKTRRIGYRDTKKFLNAERRRKESFDDGFILHTVNGFRVTRATYGAIMNKACKAAGLPTRTKDMPTYEHGFSGHGLRKGGMSAIAEAGGTTQMIMSISGHKSSRSVDPYVQDMERQRAAILAVQLRQARKAKIEAGKARTAGEYVDQIREGNRIVQLTPRKKPDGSV